MESGQNNMKRKFYSVLDNLKSNLNSTVLPIVLKYEEFIRKIKIIKSGGKKCSKDYKLLNILRHAANRSVDKLIFPVLVSGEIKYYFSLEELYEVIYDAHMGRKHRMCHEVNSRYKNITQNQITSFFRLCEEEKWL